MQAEGFAPAAVAGGLRPRRADVLLAAAMAFGSAGAERAAAAAKPDELAARFACEPLTKTMLCQLADGRTVPAQLKHQVHNAIDKLDRIGFLPKRHGVSARAIVAVVSAVASFDNGVGAAVSQRRIARRAKYSERHVRDVLRYAADVGLVERNPRWAAADRMTSGALEPVTDDRQTVYIVHLAPQDIARGATDDFLLELSSPADPPLRLRLPTRVNSHESSADDDRAIPPYTANDDQAAALSAATADAGAPAVSDAAHDSQDTTSPLTPNRGPEEPPTTPPPRRALPAALGRLADVVDQLAALTGIHLDPIDLATLATAEAPHGYGLLPEPTLDAMTELAEKIRDGACVPNPRDPRIRWSARSLRGRAGTFFKAKCARLKRDNGSGPAEQARLQREAAEREAAYKGRKAREAAEWETRQQVIDESACSAPICKPVRSHVPAPPWLREHSLAAFRRALETCTDPMKAAELHEAIDELVADTGPP